MQCYWNQWVGNRFVHDANAIQIECEGEFEWFSITGMYGNEHGGYTYAYASWCDHRPRMSQMPPCDAAAIGEEYSLALCVFRLNAFACADQRLDHTRIYGLWPDHERDEMAGIRTMLLENLVKIEFDARFLKRAHTQKTNKHFCCTVWNISIRISSLDSVFAFLCIMKSNRNRVFTQRMIKSQQRGPIRISQDSLNFCVHVIVLRPIDSTISSQPRRWFFLVLFLGIPLPISCALAHHFNS